MYGKTAQTHIISLTEFSISKITCQPVYFITDQESWLTFIGLILILSVKPVKFLTFDVAFPAVDVYTDGDAAIKHFE